MKRLTVAALILPVFIASIAAQEPQRPPTVIIQTPFGPMEVPADSPAARSNPTTPGPSTTIPPPPEPPPAGPIPAEPQQTPPTEPAADPAAQAEDEPANIELILDNQDIYAVIRIIGDTLGLNYIIDPAVQGTVNVNTVGTLRRSDLLPLLESILKINGATIIRTGNFYQIVPANTAVREPIPVEERNAQLPADDQMVMQIVRMRYVAAGEMAGLLAPYVSEGGNINAHEAANILLITERRGNLRKLLEIIDIFDTNAFEGERVRLFPVTNSAAADLIEDLEKIFAGYALSETTAIRFVPIERMNSVLVITPNATVFPEVERWLQRLDQPIETAGIRNFVYRVRNGKAADIQSVLSQLYGTSVSLSNLGNAPPAAVQPPAPTPNVPTTPGVPQPTPQGTAILPNSYIKIIADNVNNALVIQATPQDYAEIQRTIEQLDVLPRQVLIDAQIYEVVLDDSLSFGVSAALQNRGTLANPQTTASFATASAVGAPSLSAQTFAFIGRTRELVLFLNASENRSRVRTLSAPSVLVSDNMIADFQVGAEVPVPTSSSVTPVQSDGTNLFAQTIQFRPTGVILRVRPQINDSGNVTLEISQEVSQASPNTTSGVVAPVINKSSLTSSVVIQDGQTIALGGFIREGNELIRNRVPLLGRIPVAGVLFGSTRRGDTRAELIMLITPHVIRNHEEADLATEELKNKLREVQNLLR